MSNPKDEAKALTLRERLDAMVRESRGWSSMRQTTPFELAGALGHVALDLLQQLDAKDAHLAEERAKVKELEGIIGNPQHVDPVYFESIKQGFAAARIDALAIENEELKSVMGAAAVEIQEHWTAHCDEEGYGPSNLMHRLEAGIAVLYPSFTAKGWVEVNANLASARAALEKAEAEWDAALDKVSAERDTANGALLVMKGALDEFVAQARTERLEYPSASDYPSCDFHAPDEAMEAYGWAYYSWSFQRDADKFREALTNTASAAEAAELGIREKCWEQLLGAVEYTRISAGCWEPGIVSKKVWVDGGEPMIAARKSRFRAAILGVLNRADVKEPE